MTTLQSFQRGGDALHGGIGGCLVGRLGQHTDNRLGATLAHEHAALAWPYMLLGAALVVWRARELDVLALGGTQARMLGLDASRGPALKRRAPATVDSAMAGRLA